MTLDPRLAMIPATTDPQTALAARVADLERRVRAGSSPEGDDDWIAVSAFLNGWDNMGDPRYGDARFRRIASGLVLVEGTLALGTNAAIAFVLPAGYRPEWQIWELGHGWNGTVSTTVRALVKPNGEVSLTMDATPTTEAHLRVIFRAAG